MKVGDLVREDWKGGRLGVVVSKIRRSTPRDNHQLGVMYGDVHPVVDVLLTREAIKVCLLYTSPSPRDQRGSRMPSSA